MSSHHFFSRPEPDFGDSAFEPRPSFDFEEEADHPGHNLVGLQGIHGDQVDFNLVDGSYVGNDFDHGVYHDHPNHLTASNSFAQASRMSEVDPRNMVRSQVPQKSGFEAHSAMPDSQSTQSDIVESRKRHVSQQHGQITPPGDNGPEPFKVPPSKQSEKQQSRGQESGKLSNEQRARNAANTRHSRSKNSSRTRNQVASNSDGEGSQKQNKNIALQREKNRIAAAKCRAKKKSANEQQEELASDYGATNNYLTREIRDLKNQKSELQNFLLAHRPGTCECHGIHEYNFGQAQRLVLNARRHAAEPPHSPSRDAAFSTQSPGSEASADGMFSISNSASPPDTLMPPRYPSFKDSMNYVFSQGMDGPAMQSSGRDGQHMMNDFAEFLQSSPGGRAGFA